MEIGSRPVTSCRNCGAQVDPRVAVCPECGGCCPSCDTPGLQARRSNGQADKRLAMARTNLCGKLMAMHEELGHALMEAVWELDNLPTDADEGISRVFAVTDDLEAAIARTRGLDQQLD